MTKIRPKMTKSCLVMLIIGVKAKIFFHPSRRVIGACQGQFTTPTSLLAKKKLFLKKWPKNCLRSLSSESRWKPKIFFVFENGPFENYLPVNQQLQCKECSLFIAWLEELLSGGEIPVMMQCCYQLQAFQDCVGDLWSVDAMCSPLSTALTTKKTKRLKKFGIKYGHVNSHVSLATTRMVNYPMSNIWQK